MKILYIASNKREDFMADTIFHGLRSLFGSDVTDLHHLWHMSKNVDKNSLIHKFHGRGFTLSGTLDDIEIDRTDIDNKIKNRYFDFIVYGAIYRCVDKLDLVLQYYTKNKIIFIDGDDVTDILPPGEITQIPGICLDRYSIYNVQPKLLGRGIYFKRELTESDSKKYPYVKPITFGYPEEKITAPTLEKNKYISKIIPGVGDTYVFYDEKLYYDDYKQSYFGFTWKKAGWDCLRHYEIMANGCVPLFLDIKKCPSTCLFNFPKQKLIDCWKSIKNIDINKLTDNIAYNDRSTITNIDFKSFNDLKIDEDLYIEHLSYFYQYLYDNLTTKKIASYIINESLLQNK